MAPENVRHWHIADIKSGETDKVLLFNFTNGDSAALHVRRAVAEFIPSPDKYHRKPDVTLAMPEEAWVKLYMSQATPEDLIKRGDIKVTGDATEAACLIILFDLCSGQSRHDPPVAFSSQR